MIKQILFAGVLAFSAVACGGDACEDAKDKAEECNLPEAEEGEGTSVDADAECSGKNECYAECMNDASCEELKAPTLDGSYFKCLAACGE